MSLPTWKERLAEKSPPALVEEIDIFASQIALRKHGKLDESVFAETRLRRGAYGQRYDNGQRHDGKKVRELKFPQSGLTSKGPGTEWDAPGMLRIKIPYGAFSAAQMEVVAELAEEYSEAISHATTRQDIQIHYLHLEDTPDIMRRLAAVGITTREACGNSVRNVTGCVRAGVCDGEQFDITPYAEACYRFLLGHPDAQDFGRKVKVAFSGCAGESCGLVTIHDIGFVAAKRTPSHGNDELGFKMVVGGGLGAVPHQAKVLQDFVPLEEILPLCQAICRVFARLGEKKNRARARLKFTIAKLGIDEFRRLVFEERNQLAHDPRWSDLVHAPFDSDKALRQAAPLTNEALDAQDPAFRAWHKTNVRAQRQKDYSMVYVTLPLGDISSDQLRSLAEFSRQFTGDTARITVDQNLAFRWASNADLPAIHKALVDMGLATGGADHIEDVTSCPGTDTCKLGISSSRGLAAELRKQLAAATLDDAVQKLQIKISGCFNSCGQHHVADIGFYGVSRKVNGYAVPHFQVVLGGQWAENGGAYGLAIVAIPSKNIPEVVRRICASFIEERQTDETFQDYVKRIGKVTIRQRLDDLREVPSHLADPSYYSDWGDPREYTTGDMGIGECAGAVISPVQFGLADSERIAFEAQVKLDANEAKPAAMLAYQAMLTAAKTLAATKARGLGDDADTIVAAFQEHFIQTQLFFDPFAKGKFANYFIKAHEDTRSDGNVDVNIDLARQRIEEAQLFIEAAHACYGRTNLG